LDDLDEHNENLQTFIKGTSLPEIFPYTSRYHPLIEESGLPMMVLFSNLDLSRGQLFSVLASEEPNLQVFQEVSMLMQGEAIFTYTGRQVDGSEDQRHLAETISEDGFDKAELPCIYLLQLSPGSTKNAKFGCGKGKSSADDLA